MHYRCLVTVNRDDLPDDVTSSGVRQHVFDQLIAEHFVYGPRFCSGWCDWFVIGGRWSGDLAHISDDEAQKRDSYDELGADDDAAIVSKELYGEFLKEHEGANGEDPPHFVDLNWDTVSTEFVDKKWLVIVDYHG